MIGSYLPPSWRRHKARIEASPKIDQFRQELRRGCLALATLAELRTEKYGYTLRRSLKQQGLGVESGTLYPLLRRLEAQGFLVSEWRADGKRGKRFYRLTPEGLLVLDVLRLEWRDIEQTIDGIVEGRRPKAA